MKFCLLILITIILASCDDPIPNRNGLNNNAQIGDNAFARWLNTAATPITPLVISADFSVAEQAAASAMAAEWETSANNSLDFFNLPLIEVPGLAVIHGYTELNQYNDGEMGIYKSYDWFDDVSSFALAITQFRGFQRLVGTPNAYIELVHADIIMNYRDWTFSTDQSPFTYDFQSVILHELGHFIGLPHVFDTVNAVMFPSLNREEIKRAPFPLDDQRLQGNYGVRSGFSSLNGIKRPESVNTTNQIDDKRGKEVSGYMELRADGTCNHYINGKLVHSHK